MDIRSAMPDAGAVGRLSVLAAALLLVAVACSNGDDDGAATATPAEPAATETPAATAAPASDAGAEGEDSSEPTPGEAAPTDGEAAPTDGDAAEATAAAALDFGSGIGSITLGEETFEFAIGPGAGLCRDVFGIIQAGGKAADGRAIDGEFTIPPLDWESYEDGRYDPPSVELQITSTGEDNARWRADAAWAQENDKIGMSQVDAYEKDGLAASGTATFANAWGSETESVQGSFEISCSEG